MDIILTLKSPSHVVAMIEEHPIDYVIVDKGTQPTMREAMEAWAIGMWHRAKGHKPPWKSHQTPTLKWSGEQPSN